MNFVNTPIKWTGPAAPATTIWSQVMDLAKLTGISFQPNWATDLTGVLSVWVSNDYGTSPAIVNPSNPMSVGTWTQLLTPVSNQPAGSPGNTFIPVFECLAAKIVLQYANTLGSGPMGGYIAGQNQGQ